MAATAEQVIRFVGSLALVVGGALLAGRLLRRVRPGPGAGLRLLGRLSLAKGTALFLVGVDDRRFLVGSGDRGGPRLLAELEPAQGAMAPVAAPHPDPRGRARFHGRAPGASSVLEGALMPLDLPSDPSDGPGTGLVERLRRMTLRTSGRPHVAVR